MMMRPHIARTIAIKELRESLRDRRTLMLMILLPIVLYPLLMLLVVQVATMQSASLQSVASVVYVEGLPDADTIPIAVDDGESVAPSVNDDNTHPVVRALAHDPDFDVQILPPEMQGSSPVGTGAVVLDLADWSDRDASGVYVRSDDATHDVELRYDSTDESSSLALDRVMEVLNAIEQAEVWRRLELRDLPRSFIDPVGPSIEDAANNEQRGGYLLGGLLPMLVITTVLLGAYYPAIDLTAGERERGTIQTLFTAPISVLEIVVGKYVAVLCIALLSGAINLGSLALLFGQNLLLSAEFAQELDLGLSLPTLFGLLVAIVLVAIFFASLLLTVAVLAKSFKDAQTYISPVYLACIVPAMIAQLPGFEFSRAMAFVPAVNVILLMKQMLMDGVVLESVFLVTVSTLTYAALALVVASRVFSQESILVGDAGRFQMFQRRSSLKPRAQMHVGEAFALFAIGFVLLYYVGTFMQAKSLMWGLAGTLVLLVAAPALWAVYSLRCDPRTALHLQRPKWKPMVAAVLWGCSAWVPVALLTQLLSETILPIPPELAESFDAAIGTPTGAGGWIALFAILSLAPAICEELFFRGALLSSFRAHLKPWVAVVLSAGMFAVFHLSLHRLVPTFLLGCLMGILVMRSRSIATSMTAHGLNNAVALVLLAVGSEGMELPIWALLPAGAALLAGGWLLRTNDAAEPTSPVAR